MFSSSHLESCFANLRLPQQGGVCERTEHGSYAQVSLEGAPCVLDKERRPLG